MISARDRARKSRRIMSSRISGKRALKRWRCKRRFGLLLLRLVNLRRCAPSDCNFCSNSFQPAVRLRNLDGHAVDAPQQKQAAEEEKHVAHPGAEPGRHPSPVAPSARRSSRRSSTRRPAGWSAQSRCSCRPCGPTSPSGMPTMASTRQAVGNAKRRWNSIS